MKLPKLLQINVLNKLRKQYPDIRFSAGDSFYWSPGTKTVHYAHKELGTREGVFALIHETGHAVLAHKDYSYDYELLKLEVEAWAKAEEIARGINMVIDKDHVQQCLDTYRDWLSDRSVCPRCGVTSLQAKPGMYICHNCSNNWTVTNSLFCRPYRKTK